MMMDFSNSCHLVILKAACRFKYLGLGRKEEISLEMHPNNCNGPLGKWFINTCFPTDLNLKLCIFVLCFFCAQPCRPHWGACMCMCVSSIPMFFLSVCMSVCTCTCARVAGSASEWLWSVGEGGGGKKKIGHPLKQKACSQHRNRLLNFHWWACLHGNRLTLRQ